MGIYYKLINRKKCERIEPSDLEHSPIKFGAMVFGPGAQLLMFLHMQKDDGWTVIADYNDEYHNITITHRDVTKETVALFNDAVSADRHIKYDREG